jgi:CubicO group peptidase (beta-lactamase class C family)
MTDPKRILFPILCLTLFACTSKGTHPVSKNTYIDMELTDPSTVSMSAEGLERAMDIMRQAAQSDKLTGAQLLVSRHGKVVLHEAVGFADIEERRPMETSTLIKVGSNTKSVVAAGVLMLVDEGRLDLDDPVTKYLPGFDSGLARRLKIRHLLQHTTGFTNQRDGYVGSVAQKSPEFPSAPSLIVEAIKIGRVGPSIPPGEKGLYTNWGYTILGALIEKVSDQRIDQFLSERFYVPLGMTNTFHDSFAFDPKRIATTYEKTVDGWKSDPQYTSPFPSATGSIVSCAWDFSKFCQLFLNEGIYGGQRFLNAKTVRQATSLQAEAEYQYGTPSLLADAKTGFRPSWYYRRDKRELGIDIGYGFGWVISRNGAFSHAGIYGTFAMIDPREDLIVIIFTQSRGGGAPGQEFIDAVYQALEE